MKIIGNLEEFLDLIKKENVITVDIRWLNHNEIWSGISISGKQFNDSTLKNTRFHGIGLEDFYLNRHFFDPFSAHKSIIIPAKLHGIKILPKTQSNEVSFFVQLDKSSHHQREHTEKNPIREVNYALPPYDICKDMRSEVVLALSEMKCEVLSHYSIIHTASEMIENRLEINYDTNSPDIMAESMIKIRYCTWMICQIYKFSLIHDMGVFRSELVEKPTASHN